MTARVFTPPNPTPVPEGRKTIFLAGSIDMGNAGEWQEQTIAALQNYPVDIYNPRRKTWDASWEQTSSNPQFSKQVNWELDNLEAADIPAFYFDERTKSPITLFELGFCKSKDMIVACPKGFWRRGNLEVICQRWNIKLLENLEDYIQEIKQKI